MRIVVIALTFILLAGCRDTGTNPSDTCEVTGYYETIVHVDTINGTEVTAYGEKMVESDCDLNEPWCHCFDDLR